jgi:hypothetical protein
VFKWSQQIPLFHCFASAPIIHMARAGWPGVQLEGAATGLPLPCARVDGLEP